MIEYIWNKILKKIRGRAIYNSKIDSTSKIEAGSLIINSSMSRYSFCGYDCKIINTDVGAFCSIADGVVIGGAQHPIDWVSTSPVFYAGRDSVKKKFSEFNRPVDKRSYIGNDVWIGERVIIKAGVSIGDGAVVGMGAVVTHDVKPYEIVAGIPAVVIKKRFKQNIVDKLIKSQWWLLPDSDIAKCAYLIKEPEKFLEEIKK